MVVKTVLIKTVAQFFNEDVADWSGAKFSGGTRRIFDTAAGITGSVTAVYADDRVAA